MWQIKEVEELREKEKDRWKNFTQKVCHCDFERMDAKIFITELKAERPSQQ